MASHARHNIVFSKMFAHEQVDEGIRYEIAEIEVSPLFVLRFIQNVKGFEVFVSRLIEFVKEEQISPSAQNVEMVKQLVDEVAQQLKAIPYQCNWMIDLITVEFTSVMTKLQEEKTL